MTLEILAAAFAPKFRLSGLPVSKTFILDRIYIFSIFIPKRIFLNHINK